MATLTDTSLSRVEQRALERFVTALREHFGDDLDALWLYGSRARGEVPHEESDVDLILLLREPSGPKHIEAIRLIHDAQDAEGARAAYFSLKLHDREWVEGRRTIESFFLQEVDRDKIVLYGEP